MNLAPIQASTNSSIPTNMPEKRAAALLSDPIFASIHDAFLLGSSLAELKGRIQIVACNSALDAVTFDKDTSTFRSAPGASPRPASGAPKQQPNVINALLDDIVLNTISQGLSAALRDDAWTTSVLRAIFQQVVTLHVKCLPDCSTKNTIYDTPPPPQNAQDLATYPYPYLYPSDDAFDYANIGINSIQDTSASSFATDFRLYDVTRRALNCLTLLLDEAQESLVPAVIDRYQRELVQAVLANPPVSPSTPDCTELDRLLPDTMKAAINQLASQTIRFLEAWDSLLRENFYANTHHQASEPEGLIVDNEITLAAYEAGRSLASLSWNVSVAIAPLECALTAEQENDPAIEDALARKAQTVWRNAFNDRDINSLQYQITALSTALDLAYYRVNPQAKLPASDDPLAPPNIDLPGQSLEAVKHSLDYWQRTVALLCSPGETTIKPALNPSSPSSLPSHDAPANSSATTVERVPGPSERLNWKLSKTLRVELIQQVAVWQALILYQQGLQSFSMEVVTQRILNDFMQDVEQAVRNELLTRLLSNKHWRRLSLVGIVVALIIILMLILVAVTNFHDLSLPALVTAGGAIVTTTITAIAGAALTGLGGTGGKGTGGLLGRSGGILELAGTAIEESLQRGYERILIEFDDLNHYVAITFPLIEFFIWEQLEIDGKPVKDGYDFLVNVFWTGSDFADELKRVARAAFGPISSFIDAQIKVAAPVEKGAQKS